MSNLFRITSSNVPSGWTDNGGGSYSATVEFYSDQTGNSYSPLGIQIGYRVFTGTFQIYDITNVSSQTLSQADITIQTINGTTGQPTSQISVYDPATPRETVTLIPFGAVGYTAQLEAAINTYNLGRLLDEETCEEFTITGNTITVSGTLPIDELNIKLLVNGNMQSTAYYTRTGSSTITTSWNLNNAEVKVCYHDQN